MNIENIKALGLWPDSKKTTTNKGLAELENLGYNLAEFEASRWNNVTLSAQD